jgi:hypothetical protein
MPKINQAIIEDAPIVVPSLQEQEAYIESFAQKAQAFRDLQQEFRVMNAVVERLRLAVFGLARTPDRGEMTGQTASELLARIKSDFGTTGVKKRRALPADV